MSVKPRNVLKSFFENGDKPNHNEFVDLIDSFIHINEGVSNGANNSENSGVVNNVGTNNDGNLVLTFTNGSTTVITNNGSVGGARMPVLFKNSYDKVYFVSEEKGNDETAVSNSFRFYKSIVKASEDARVNYDATGNKNLVFVFKGTYNEESVNREHVDMYFEEGSVVWTEGADSSVINDKLEPITNANVYGKAVFVNKRNDPGVDSEGINFRQASSVYIEAKLVDSIQIYNPDIAHLEVANTSIIYDFYSHQNKTIIFRNCSFLNGCIFPQYRTYKCSYRLYDCEFYLQPFPDSDLRNKTSEIVDFKGDFLFRIDPVILSSENLVPEIDAENKNHDEILSEIYNIYTGDYTGISLYRQNIACISYIQANTSWFGYGLCDIIIKDSKLIIRRENCFGVILSKRRNGVDGEGHILFQNLTVLDETQNKNTVAIGTGWGDGATRQPGLGIDGFIHNCKVSQLKITPASNEWEITFNSIGDFVSKKDGGVFEGDLHISPKGHKYHMLLTDSKADAILLRANKEANGYGNVVIGKNGWELRNNNMDIPSGNYTTGMTIQSNIVDNEEGNYTYFDGAPSTPEDEKVHFFRMIQRRSIFTVGMNLGGLRNGYVSETNDNIVTLKSYVADLRVKDKFRILNSQKDTANVGVSIVKLPTGEIVEAVSLKIDGDIHSNGEYFHGDDKKLIKFSDAWLRLNPTGDFESGVYCGNKTLRTDGEFQVGGAGSKFKVQSNGNTTVFGNLSGKSVDGEYSHLYRFGGVHFTWDSDTYGTQAQHSIKSAYGTTMGDSLTMNSFNNIRLNIDSNNNNTNSKFEIGNNTSGVSNVLFSIDESGDIVTTGSLLGASDIKLKKEIHNIEEPFLDKICSLEPKYYKWKDEAKKQNLQLGFIAQEVETIFPEWVSENENFKSVSYDKMGAVLATQGIKELKEEVESLKEQIKELKSIINNL